MSFTLKILENQFRACVNHACLTRSQNVIFMLQRTFPRFYTDSLSFTFHNVAKMVFEGALLFYQTCNFTRTFFDKNLSTIKVTQPRPSEISEKNWSTKARPLLKTHL